MSAFTGWVSDDILSFTLCVADADRQTKKQRTHSPARYAEPGMTCNIPKVAVLEKVGQSYR